jgi:hypothetical protein
MRALSKDENTVFPEFVEDLERILNGVGWHG